MILEIVIALPLIVATYITYKCYESELYNPNRIVREMILDFKDRF